MNVYSHSGRSRSKPAMPVLRAKSMTGASVFGGGASNRRTCHDRSKSGSTTQRGVASRRGDCTTRWRSPGVTRLARSSRSISRSQSGLRSKIMTLTTVERSSGSSSMYHEKASLSRMCNSTRSLTTPPPVSSSNVHPPPEVVNVGVRDGQPPAPHPRALQGAHSRAPDGFRPHLIVLAFGSGLQTGP